MRSYSVLIYFFVLFCTPAFSQYTDLQMALREAAKGNKLVLLQLDSKDCRPCNEAASSALSDKTVQAGLQQSFVRINIAANSGSWLQVAEMFHSGSGGSTLFFDESGTLIHRYNATSSNPQVYAEQMKQAIARRSSGARFRTLENNYREGDRSPGLMENLMVARNRVGLDTDSLLQEYVRNLPADSLKSRRTIIFIARMCPVLGSAADKALRNNSDFFSQCWFSIPADQRVAINNNIIRKSKQAAILARDADAAYLVAGFAKSTYFDLYNAQRIFDQTMIEYFREAHDTTKYIPMAVYYYDTYFMTVPVDSIQVIDTLKLREYAAKEGAFSKTLIPPALTTELYSKQLGSAAWSLYGLTKDSAALSRALNWAKRATEFSASSSALDVYARLLYHFGELKKGIEFEENAIEELKRRKLASADQEAILKLMKEGKKL